MKTSLFDVYKVGVGPSSSHTMGPMRAARRFVAHLQETSLLGQVARLEAELYGSLALTGMGHGTDRAIILGLLGEEPSTVDPAAIEEKLNQVRESGELRLLGGRPVPFCENDHLIFRRNQMYPPEAKTAHPNGMRFTAYDAQRVMIERQVYFSVGGGFIVKDGEGNADAPFTGVTPGSPEAVVPYSFRSAEELLEMAGQHGLTISGLMLRNESALKNGDEPAVRVGILHIWMVMQECVARGIASEGTLPGGLNVRRRAYRLAERLRQRETAAQAPGDPLAPLE